MRIISFFILATLSILTLSVSAKNHIGTIDYWHVFYNKKSIAQFNERTIKPLIIIKMRDIKANDILSVEYGDDTPDDNYQTGLYALDDESNKAKMAEGRGTFNRLKIPVSKILETWKRSHKRYLDFYYFDNRRDKFVFKLRFID